MDYKINNRYHRLVFKRPSGTSRGVLNHKDSWILSARVRGVLRLGEVSIIDGLSIESPADVHKLVAEINSGMTSPIETYPSSIRFGLEMLKLSAEGDEPFKLGENPFYTQRRPIKINGLIWMGDKQFMFDQIKTKIEQGFDCIKMKIGAIDFDQELELIKYIRSQYSISDIQLRVDANGAFSVTEALEKIKKLSDYTIHSIEQPIKPGHWEDMAALCETDIMSIALDEELIGDYDDDSHKVYMLSCIKPHYIILKPSLMGGLNQSDQWVRVAEELGISWWATSALESNIGLNAIAQWVSSKSNELPQGLGTGQLYQNNIQSPLEITDGHLCYNHNNQWDLSSFETLT